jgi:hypothetical protein
MELQRSLTTNHYRFTWDSPLVHIHGALFTTWVLLFIVQTALVAQGRVALHRKLGIAGAVLAAAMVMSGTAIRVWEARLLRGLDMTASLSALVLGISDLLIFATVVTTAIALRRNKETHKRLMLLAYISILGAAIGRIPGVGAWTMTLLILFIVVGMAYDFLSRRQVHKAYLWGGTLFVISIGALKFL